MKESLRSKLTFSNVIALIALFIAIGGSAYAATQLKKNSVGTKQIKNGAVTGIKIKKQTITGKNINLAKLGMVPSAANAGTAGTANALTAPEASRVVGASGQPPFLDGSSSNTEFLGAIKLPPVGFYKDHEGIVHLEGLAKVGPEESPIKGLIFNLPSGYRPASGTSQIFTFGSSGIVIVFGSNVSIGGKNIEGDVLSFGGGTEALLNGIAFRAGS